MKVTSTDRDELVRRVLRRVQGTSVNEAVVRAAVDQVAAAFPHAPAPTTPAPVSTSVIVVHRDGTPDLLSRLRAALPADVRSVEMRAASEGRHTVVAVRVDASHQTAVEQAAATLGASCIVRTVA